MAKVGRPLKFQSVDELQTKIDAYFESCFDNVVISIDKETGLPIRERRQIKPFTITGLAYYLDTNRQTLLNYEKDNQYFDTLSRAKTKIEAYNEEQLYTPKISNGVAFNLKNNFDWVDKHEVDQTIHADGLEIIIGGKKEE